MKNSEDGFGITLPPGFDWQHWAQRWDRMQEHYLVRRKERFAQIIALIDATQTHVHRVLDLGCGPGTLTLALLEAYPQAEVYGIDFDPNTLTLAQARLADFGDRVHLLQADLRRTAWAERLPPSINAIVSATALHWLEPNALAALYHKVAGLLLPGGILLNADHVGSQDRAIQQAWEAHQEQERTSERQIRMGEQNADDWDTFWTAFSQALGYERAAGQPSIDGWQGGVEKGLPLSWHLDQLRSASLTAVDCFARWDCDALYGGIKEGTREL